MSWPRGYQMLIPARDMAHATLRREAEKFRAPAVRADPDAAIREWIKNNDVLQMGEPPERYTGMVLTPEGEEQYRWNGVVITKWNSDGLLFDRLTMR